MLDKIAKIISIVFHPVLIPTLGFILLLNSGFYFSMLSWDAKRFVLLAVVFTSCILPVLFLAILALNPRFNVLMPQSRDRIFPLLASSAFYYLGFLLLSKLTIVPEFKLLMLASALVLIALLVISFSWKISLHMAAIGGFSGALFALSFKNGVNPVYPLLIVILASGLVGSARLLLNKHTIWQVAAGYGVGFCILYLVMYFF